MEYDFSEIIAAEVRQAEPALDARLEAQAKELSDLECTYPVIGKWLDEYGLAYLLAAFALNDEDFAESFPKLAHISRDDRKKIMETFEDHVSHRCLHCAKKDSYDTELNGRIERAIRSGHSDKGKVFELPNAPHHYCLDVM